MLNSIVLVVEDDLLVNRAMEAALRAAGYQASAASSCGAGLALALEKRPALLVLDIGLPDGSGWSLLQQLRQALPDHQMPVIVTSSNQVTRAQLKENRVQRFVAKPFNMPEFLEAVGALLPLTPSAPPIV